MCFEAKGSMTALERIEVIVREADAKVTAVLDEECAKVLSRCPTLIGFDAGMGRRWFVHRDGAHLHGEDDIVFDQYVGRNKPWPSKPHVVPKAAMGFLALFDHVEEWHYLHEGYAFGDDGRGKGDPE